MGSLNQALKGLILDELADVQHYVNGGVYVQFKIILITFVWMSAVGRVVSAVEGAGVVGHSVEIVGRRAARGRLPAVVAGLDGAKGKLSKCESNYEFP